MSNIINIDHNMGLFHKDFIKDGFLPSFNSFNPNDEDQKIINDSIDFISTNDEINMPNYCIFGKKGIVTKKFSIYNRGELTKQFNVGDEVIYDRH